MQTRQHQITLDGVTFEGELPFHIHEKRPELGPLTRGEDLKRFNRAVAAAILHHKLLGPEALRFCRKTAALGVEEFASLTGRGRKAVQRWENGEVAVPPLEMLLAVTLALGPDFSISSGDLHLALLAFVEEHNVPETIHVEAA